jgi:HK97 family phage portal protein
MTTLVTRDSRLLPTQMPAWRDDYTVTAGGQGSVELAGALTRTYETIIESNPNGAAVVNKLVRLIATLPVGVFDRPSPEGAAEEVRGHPLGELLSKPAPRRGQAYWKQGLARSALVHGDGLLAKWRGPSKAGAPQALLSVAWPYVTAYAPLGCPVEWWSTTQTGLQRFFPVEDSVHLAWESQDLHGLGVSPLKPLAETIKLDDSTRRYQSASLNNGARPSSAIIPPEGFRYQGNERELLRSEINRIHGGVDEAMKAALLAPGFDWKPLSFTAVEAEVIAARNLGREEFAMVYDIPPPMIGDLTHGTYSNVEELHRILYVTTLRPWLKLIEETLQRQLIDEEEEWSSDLYIRFNLDEVLRGNPREEIDAASEAFNNGLKTLNEARAMIGMPPVDPAKDPEGLADIPHIQSNNMRAITAAATDPQASSDPNALPPGNPDMVPPKPQTPTKAQRAAPLREDQANR